eukprot:COSAG01_NODE_592_length_15109_cov_39.247435_4_plen_830_part_00
MRVSQSPARRSPRLNKSPAGARNGKENAPNSMPSGTPPSALKRGLQSHQPADTATDTLPAAFDIPTDSPAYKKSRQSDVRKSRVSWGGIELQTFYKDADRPQELPSAGPLLPAASQQAASQSELADQFFSPRPSQPLSDDGSDTADTQPVPTLMDELAGDETEENLLAQPVFDDEDETVPVPKLSELGNFDDTHVISATTVAQAASAAETTDELNPSTAFIAAGVVTRPSMAFEPDTAPVRAPSLQGLVQRATTAAAQEEAEEDEKEEVENTDQPHATAELDDSMEMTGCYGGIVPAAEQQSSTTSPELVQKVGVSPSLAAASVTTLAAKPPASPNLMNLLRKREEPTEGAGAEDAPMTSETSGVAASSTLDSDSARNCSSKVSMTPQLKSLMKRKGTSALLATADLAPPSPAAAGTILTSPMLLRAGARLTMTPSGASPHQPVRSPHSSPAPLPAASASLAGDQIEPMPMNDMMDGEVQVVDDATASLQINDAAEDMNSTAQEADVDAATACMPDTIPEGPVQSPVQQHQSKLTRYSSMGGGVMKDMIRRRSSIAPSSGASMLPVIAPKVDHSTVATTIRTCNQFLAVADIRFLDDLSTNRRNTMMCRPPTAPATTLDECIKIYSTSLSELRAMQGGCDDVTTQVADIQKAIANVEKAAERCPPALFNKLSDDTRSEMYTLLRGKLATLKRNCRKEAKFEWYSWHTELMASMAVEAAAEGKRLVDEATVLANRAAAYEAAEQKLCKYMGDLGVQPLDGKQPVRTAEEASEVDALERSADGRRKVIAANVKVRRNAYANLPGAVRRKWRNCRSGCLPSLQSVPLWKPKR